MKQALVLLVILAIGGVAFYQLKRPSAPKDQKSQLKSIITSDRSKDFQVRDALIQLAYQKDADALTFALERAHHENERIRGGAAEALGFYETPESTAALENLLNDQNHDVRMHAIRGLYHMKTETRIALVRSLLKRTNLSDAEKLKAKEVLFRVSSDPQDRRDSVEALVAYARTGQTGKHLQAGLMAASLASDNRSVQAYVKDMMRKEREPAFVSAGIYMFAESKDREVGQNLPRYLKNSETSVRVAAVATIPKYCQKDRFKALKQHLAEERDPDVLRSAIDALKMMPGQASLGVLDWAIKSGNFSGQTLTQFERARVELQKKSPELDSCR